MRTPVRIRGERTDSPLILTSGVLLRGTGPRAVARIGATVTLVVSIACGYKPIVSHRRRLHEKYSPRRGSIAETIARSLRLPIRKGTCRLRKADDIDITPAPGSREAVAMISDAIPSPAVGFFLQEPDRQADFDLRQTG